MSTVSIKSRAMLWLDGLTCLKTAKQPISQKMVGVARCKSPALRLQRANAQQAPLLYY